MTCFTRIERVFESVDRIIGALNPQAVVVPRTMATATNPTFRTTDDLNMLPSYREGKG